MNFKPLTYNLIYKLIYKLKFNLKFTSAFRQHFSFVFFGVLVLLLNCNNQTFANQINDIKQETILKIDTLKIQKEDNLPSSYNDDNIIFTPSQDSAYYRAMRSNVTSGTRIWNDLHLTQYTWYEYLKNIKKSDVALAMEGLSSLPKEYFLPDPTEVVQREINIANAFYVPFVNTYSRNGVRVNFDDIGRFLGITEDVSPEINYKLDKPTNVMVVIYSISAVVIAKLFDGNQPSGNYTLNWNGRDDNGKKMPAGDYIAEVRIANEKYIRKRIIIQ